MAPEGKNIDESNRNLDIISDFMLEEQKATGIKLLWGTANLFGNPRYKHGAGTSPNADAFSYAAAQVNYFTKLHYNQQCNIDKLHIVTILTIDS